LLLVVAAAEVNLQPVRLLLVVAQEVCKQALLRFRLAQYQ
jgi:hypothetical protein